MVKDALLSAYARLGPALWERMEQDRKAQKHDDTWILAALQRDIGGDVLVCDYAASLGRPVWVFAW